MFSVCCGGGCEVCRRDKHVALPFGCGGLCADYAAQIDRRSFVADSTLTSKEISSRRMHNATLYMPSRRLQERLA